MKKKLLFIIHYPPPIHGASLMGGYIKSSKLINRNYNCSYINLSASKTVSEVGDFNFRKFIFLFKNIGQIFLEISKNKFDLIYLTPTSDGIGFYRDFILVKLLRLFRFQIILHFQNKASSNWSNKYINRILLKSFFKGVSVVLLGKELFLEKMPYVSEDRVFYCPNCAPIVPIIDFYKDTGNNSFRFLFLANIMVEKGVFVLIEACKILIDKGYIFECDFVGDWKDISEAEVQNERSLEGFVHFHGPKYKDEKAFFLANANCFVFPTFYHGECFPLVLLEAMSFGLPCISSFEGCIPSIIDDGETGFCVEAKNAEALAEKMAWMMNNPRSAETMGKRGYEKFLGNYTLNHFEQRLKAILEECL